MDEAQIWPSIRDVFCDVMDNPDIVVGPDTTAKDITEWDSITHVMLIFAVEKKFGVKFTAAEIQSLQNAGELVAQVRKKMP